MKRGKSQLRLKDWLENKENKLSSWRNRETASKKKLEFMIKSKRNKEFLIEANQDQKVKILIFKMICQEKKIDKVLTIHLIKYLWKRSLLKTNLIKKRILKKKISKTSKLMSKVSLIKLIIFNKNYLLEIKIGKFSNLSQEFFFSKFIKIFQQFFIYFYIILIKNMLANK